MPSTTDRVKYINRYIGPVKLIPIDIQEDSFEIKGGKFDPSKLELDNAENHKMREAVLKVLRKGVDLSNSNLVKNADGLLATRPTNKNIQWVGKTGKRVHENLYPLSYYLFCSI